MDNNPIIAISKIFGGLTARIRSHCSLNIRRLKWGSDLDIKDCIEEYLDLVNKSVIHPWTQSHAECMALAKSQYLEIFVDEWIIDSFYVLEDKIKKEAYKQWHEAGAKPAWIKHLPSPNQKQKLHQNRTRE